MADQSKKRFLFLAFLIQRHGTSCILNKTVLKSVKTTRVVFSSNNFLGTVFFCSLQFYLLKKQSQIQTNKIVFQREKLFYLVRTLRNQD